MLSYSIDGQAQDNGGAISNEVRINGATEDEFDVRTVGHRVTVPFPPGGPHTPYGNAWALRPDTALELQGFLKNKKR